MYKLLETQQNHLKKQILIIIEKATRTKKLSEQ